MKTQLLVLALMAGAGGIAQAQTPSHLGPQLGYNFDRDALVIGAQFSTPIGQQLEFYPSFNVFLVDGASVWAVNGEVKYRLPLEGEWMYLASGLNVSVASAGGSSNSDVGLNLIAGFESRKGNVHPFGELRFTVGDGSTAQLVGGLNFTLGRH